MTNEELIRDLKAIILVKFYRHIRVMANDMDIANVFIQTLTPHMGNYDRSFNDLWADLLAYEKRIPTVNIAAALVLGKASYREIRRLIGVSPNTVSLYRKNPPEPRDMGERDGELDAFIEDAYNHLELLVERVQENTKFEHKDVEIVKRGEKVINGHDDHSGISRW